MVLENYPNPFNSSTTIRYQLPRDNHVTLKLFNLAGQALETLVDAEQPAGSYTVTLTADDLPTGVYFYQLQSRNWVETRKCILIR